MADVEIKGLDELLAKLTQLGVGIDEALEAGMKFAVEDVKGRAKILCPVDTGELRNSIQSHVRKETSGEVVGVVFSNSDHAAFVEFGTGPVGADTPVPGKYPGPLHYRETGWSYYNEKEDRWVHSKGQAAQPFLYPALIQSIPTIPKRIAGGLHALLLRLARKEGGGVK